MCWMLVKQAGKQVDFRYMDKAQKHNSDGYGVAWYENGFVNTYKTFNYNTFKGIVAALKQYTIVAHLRHATKGSRGYENIHPFDVPSGVLFHNGTMQGLGNSDVSDSKTLANIISKCDYKYIEDIAPLIQPYINDKINRLVFFEDNGLVTIMNKHLGIEEDGVWYSNDYHIKEDSWCRGGSCKPTPSVPDKVKDKKHKVFVYGTLKRGYGNNRLLKDAVFLGKASTVDKWAMTGAGRSFPYMYTEHKEGEYVIGEVYLVDDSELASLDSLEGYPYHYTKQEIDILYDDDSTLDRVTVYTKAHYDKSRLNPKEFISDWRAS